MIMDSVISMKLIFLFTLFSFVSISSSQPSYKDHCSSIVPESPTKYLIPSNYSFPLGDHHTGYFTTTTDKIIDIDPSSSWNIFTFNLKGLWSMQEAESSALFKIEATISFSSNTNTNTFYYYRNHVKFSLKGFWSESSGKICMVGFGHGYSKKGDPLNLDVVFKLHGVFNESNISSLISGSLESSSSENGDDGNYFEPFSILMFPKENYNYTLDSIEAEKECSYGDDGEKGLPIGNSLSFCSYPLSRVIKKLKLEYPSDCNSSSKNCTPISGKFPSLMNLRGIECSPSENHHRFRVLLRFMNGSYFEYNQGFNPETMLVGEGWWDEKKNRSCVVACHVMGNSSSHRVGDCLMRLRFRFPSIWSINSTSEIVGQIWSKKSVNDSGYFKRMTFRTQLNGRVEGVSGMNYEYSMLGQVKKSCPSLAIGAANKGRRYPNANSKDMRFDMSVRESNKGLAWGYSAPIFVDDHVYDSSWPRASDLINEQNLFNMSYKITFRYKNNSTLVERNSLFNLSSARVKITAEGTYDAKTGTLCMIGCRDLVSHNGLPIAHSEDCEILVKFQFPSLDSISGSIKGRIESTRNKSSDPLYFNPLDLFSASSSTEAVEKVVWGMDMEVTMVLISTTLACVFVGLQLYHVKKNQNVLPLISLTMMLILTLGYMIPLVLNLEALLSQNPNNKNFVFGNVGWLEVNEISVRLTTMVAFLLQFRLLQITWSSRNTDESNNNLWSSENKAAYVTLPLYAAGLLIAMLLEPKNHGNKSPSSWENFKSYGGLVLDGFLLPQIILNLFTNMRDNVLSYGFYFGTTLVRLLPHAYDLYRAHNYAQQDNAPYYYADPSADFYSTAWDIVIPLGGILFAIVIFLQQRFGPQCVLPRRFKGSKVYEKVPVVIDSEQTSNM